MEQSGMCTDCKQFYGNPDYNNMCSSCYKKNTPVENMSDAMKQQYEKEKVKIQEKIEKDKINQQRQDILNVLATKEFDAERLKKIEELKHLIKNDPLSRPKLAFDFMVENNIWLTCEEAQELTTLATGSWIAYHVFFERCIDLHRIKDGEVMLATTGGGAGYYMEYEKGKTACAVINNLSNQQLLDVCKNVQNFKNANSCQLCGNYGQGQCHAWQHGTQQPDLIDWTGYNKIQ